MTMDIKYAQVEMMVNAMVGRKNADQILAEALAVLRAGKTIGKGENKLHHFKFLQDEYFVHPDFSKTGEEPCSMLIEHSMIIVCNALVSLSDAYGWTKTHGRKEDLDDFYDTQDHRNPLYCFFLDQHTQTN